jgi:hypothetical protein
MLQPKQTKKLKTAVEGTASNLALSAGLTRMHPMLDLGYDLYNIYDSLSEGDLKGVAANTFGALIPFVSGKAIESSIGAYIPDFPQIEKEKFKFNLNSTNQERMGYLKKYGQGYLNNPEFIKNEMKINVPVEKPAKKGTKKYALGTDEFGVDPNKRKLFDESSMSSQGFADVGFNTSSKNFGLSGGVGFNPENLYGRVGGSFNKEGFNASGEFTQRPEGNYGVNANAGYGNENINASLGYSKTNDNEFVTGNVSAGSDKLKLIMDYLKNAEGDSLNTNLLFQNEIMGASGEPVGTLNSSIGAGVNPEDAFISGGLDYSTKAFQQGKGFNYNAGINYSDLGGPNINVGAKYRFANGTNQDGIMKKSMNPRKKYANGSNLAGIANPGQIPSPSETLNDYNIMMAKASSEAMSNPWLPVVSIVGNLAQQAASMGYKFKGGGADTGATDTPEKNAMGNNNVQQDVEVEGGEMYETPQGQVGEFQGPTHEEGGIPLEVGQDVEEGTKVYSDRLKIGKKTLAERKATRERQIANLEKQATQPNVDQALKNALQRKMAALQKEEDMDLAFQGQVDEMQQMADMAVQTFAFGTAMEGIQDNPIGDSMRYGYGTSARGIKKYAVGTDDFGLLGDPPVKTMDPITEQAYYTWLTASREDLLKRYSNKTASKDKMFKLSNPNIKKEFQTFLFGDKAGTKDAENNYTIDGDFGKTTNAFAKKYNDMYTQINDNMSIPGAYYKYPGGTIDKIRLDKGTYKNPPMVVNKGVVEMDLATPQKNSGSNWKTMSAVPTEVTDVKKGIENYAITKEDLDKVILPEDSKQKTEEKGPSKFSKVLTKLGEVTPGVGDMTKLIGNYMGMTAGMKGAYEQRASDVTQKNTFANAGKKAQELYDQALKNLEGQKAQALLKSTTQQRTAQRSGRNSARGINQVRAIDWLYNSAATTAANDIVNNTQGQIAQIFQAKAGASMNADQMVGTGEYQANMANMASKDAFYTALGQGRKDFATGLQQTGKDLNDMKENKIIQNLMKNYGKWVGASNTGELMNKAGITQDSKTKQYKDASGKILTEEEVQAALLKVK